MNESWHAAWVAALDELELALEDTERLLRSNQPAAANAWTPPSLPVPMPEQLLPRAHELVARQKDVMAATLEAMTTARQQLELVDKVAALAGARRPDRPVYVDLTA